MSLDDKINFNSEVTEKIVFSKLRRGIDKFSIPIFQECQKKFFYVLKEYVFRDNINGNIKTKVYYPTEDNLRYEMRSSILKKLFEDMVEKKMKINLDYVKKTAIAVTLKFKYKKDRDIDKHIDKIRNEVVKDAYKIYELIQPIDLQGEKVVLDIELECDFYEYMRNRIIKSNMIGFKNKAGVFTNPKNGNIKLKTDYPAIVKLDEDTYNVIWFSNISLDGITLRNSWIVSFLKMIRVFIKDIGKELEMGFITTKPYLKNYIIYDLIDMKRYVVPAINLDGKFQENSLLNLVKTLKLGLINECHNSKFCKICTNKNICRANKNATKKTVAIQKNLEDGVYNALTNEYRKN